MTDERRQMVRLAATGKTKTNMLYPSDDTDFECDTKACAFNKNGTCKYYRVEDDFPIITEEDGCLSGILEDGDLL